MLGLKRRCSIERRSTNLGSMASTLVGTPYEPKVVLLRMEHGIAEKIILPTGPGDALYLPGSCLVFRLLFRVPATFPGIP